MRELNEKDLLNAIYGGCILGGGGGGAIELGLEYGKAALDKAEILLAKIEEFKDEDLIINVSLIGAPAAKDKYVDESDYKYTIESIQNELGKEIKAIFTNENGGGASVNGWIQAAISSLPILDTIGNGRAHPTGIMGSLNLHKDSNYESIQSFSGGDPKLGNKVSGVTRGNINKVAKVVRNAADAAGGLVAVARNPITIKHLKDNGAIEALTKAIELGKIFNNSDLEDRIDKICEFLSANIITEGAVKNYNIETEGGFDLGSLDINNVNLTFWNEYMTAEKSNERIFTFPDLLMTFDAKTKMPVTSAEIKNGQEIILIGTSKENLSLASPMFEEDLLKEVGVIINKEMLECY